MRHGTAGQESATNSGKAWTAALKSAESETAGIKDSSCTSGAQARSGAGGDEAAMAPIGLEGDRVAVTGTRTTAVSAGAESIAAKYFGSLASEATAADWAAVVGQLERELAEERFEHEETKRDLYDERKASLKSAASATAPSAGVRPFSLDEQIAWMRETLEKHSERVKADGDEPGEGTAMVAGIVASLERLKSATSATTPSAEVEPLLLNWLREKAPDCGDNSCLFGGRGKGGMRTNGGCRCFKDVRPDMHRIFIERMWQAVSSMPSATASTMLDEAIELLRSVEFTTAVVAKCPVCLGFEKDGNGETSRHHNATCKLADFLRRSDSGKADK